MFWLAVDADSLASDTDSFQRSRVPPLLAPSATMADVTSPLISAPELAKALAGANPPVLLDVRWRLAGPPGIAAYRAGHLPGAVYLDVDADLAGPPGPAGRHPLPETGAFEAVMRRAGVSAERDVVVYDDTESLGAARAWWLLRYFGHDRVRVLDRGYQGWLVAAGPVSTETPEPAEGDFVGRPGGMPVVDAAGAAEIAKGGVLFDARAGERYRGEVEPIDPIAGHIPGAVSAPTTDNVVAGEFRDPMRLRERFAALGATAGVPVGSYCGSGVNAAHQVLALELAGIPAALYVGSWSNWITDRLRPVARGAEPAG
jgi:thiosulfate/3-mercaptopyruvate sulfurtransferase